MVVLVLVCLLIAALCLGTLGLVAVGMAGHGADRMPRFAARSRRYARHLDGVGTAPQPFADFVTDPRASMRRGAVHIEHGARSAWDAARPGLEALRAQAETHLHRAQQEHPALRRAGAQPAEHLGQPSTRLVSH